MSCTCAAPHRPIALFGQRQRGESCYRNLLSPRTSRPTLLITISLIMCTLLHFNSSRHGSLEMGSWRKLEAGVSFLVAPFLIGSNNRNQVNVSVQFTCWFAGTLRAAASAPATVLNLSSSSSECVNILAASLLDTIAICPTVAHRKRFLIKSPNWTELNWTVERPFSRTLAVYIIMIFDLMTTCFRNNPIKKFDWSGRQALAVSSCN